MKYYIIAGEASGDLHGSNLMKELKNTDLQAEFRFWGGDLMSEQSDNLVKHYKHHAFMGGWEVITHLKTISNNLTSCKEDLLKYRPDVLILIDYPGFNLRIAKFAHKNKLKVFYYISPKVWAWKKSRVKSIKKYVDKMFVIFPFETDFYSKYNYPVAYIGNPLLDAISQRLDFNEHYASKEDFIQKNNLEQKPIVALLAGSRRQEIKYLLPIMTKVANQYPDHQFIIAGMTSIETEYYQKYILSSNVYLLENKTYDILQYSTAAIVTSGTATLETALFEVPEVVCYKFSEITFQLARLFVRIKYFSLVNLIMDDDVVLELLQHQVNEKNIKKELDKLLFNDEYRNTMLTNFKQLKSKLGSGGASKKIAEIIINELKN